MKWQQNFYGVETFKREQVLGEYSFGKTGSPDAEHGAARLAVRAKTLVRVARISPKEFTAAVVAVFSLRRCV